MVNRRTWRRLKAYGIRNFLLSASLLLPLSATILLILCSPDLFTAQGRDIFVETATSISQGLIAVTLTGLAILVSFSDRDFLVYFKNKGNFDALLFIFEYVVVLSVVSAIFGLILQSYSYSTLLFYLFFFVFFHTIMSLLSVINTVLRFAESKADFDAIQRLDPDDIPNALKEDMQDALTSSECKSNEKDSTNEHETNGRNKDNSD